MSRKASKSYVYYMGLTYRSNSAGGGLLGGAGGALGFIGYLYCVN